MHNKKIIPWSHFDQNIFLWIKMKHILPIHKYTYKRKIKDLLVVQFEFYIW